MDKLKKFLRKLPVTEQKKVVSALYLIRSGQFEGLNIKALKGSKELFRARLGHYRIIYRLTDKNIEIVDVSHRSEKTYREI